MDTPHHPADMFLCQRACGPAEPEYDTLNMIYAEPPPVFYDPLIVCHQPLEPMLHYALVGEPELVPVPVPIPIPTPAPRRRPSQQQDDSGAVCLPHRRRPSQITSGNMAPTEHVYRRQSLQENAPRVRRRPLVQPAGWGELEAAQRQVCELSLSGGPAQQMAMVESSWWPVVDPPAPPPPPAPLLFLPATYSVRNPYVSLSQYNHNSLYKVSC